MLINSQSSWQTQREGRLAHFTRLGNCNKVGMFSHQVVTVPTAAPCPLSCSRVRQSDTSRTFVLQENVFHQHTLSTSSITQRNASIYSAVFASWIARHLQHYSKCTYFGKRAETTNYSKLADFARRLQQQGIYTRTQPCCDAAAQCGVTEPGAQGSDVCSSVAVQCVYSRFATSLPSFFSKLK